MLPQFEKAQSSLGLTINWKKVFSPSFLFLFTSLPHPPLFLSPSPAWVLGVKQAMPFQVPSHWPFLHIQWYKVCTKIYSNHVLCNSSMWLKYKRNETKPFTFIFQIKHISKCKMNSNHATFIILDIIIFFQQRSWTLQMVVASEHANVRVINDRQPQRLV